MIDYWALAGDFAPGQYVQKYMPPGALSPFVGRVTAVLKGLGCVDVQWPFGNERVFSDELVRVNPELVRYLPPTLDQSYLSYDILKGRQAAATAPNALWRTIEVPAGFHRDLAKLWATRSAALGSKDNLSDVEAYDTLWRVYGSTTPNEVVLSEVEQFYRVASNLADVRLTTHATRTAAYWVAQNRQYRVTQDEIKTRKPFCPKCGTKMRRTTYKMDKGARHKLWGCPKDLFLVKVTDLLGPQGEPVEW